MLGTSAEKLSAMKVVMSLGGIGWSLMLGVSFHQIIKTQIKLNPDQGNQTQRTNIITNEHQKEQTCWRSDLLNGHPEGVAAKPWVKWWEYKLEKRKGRKPAAKMLSSQAEDFKVMKRQGFDIAGVVDFAISRGWERIGSPDWAALKCFKGHERKNDLLGAVK